VSRYTWILDPGHGGVDANGVYLTAGKRSPAVPPGIYEGQFNREVAQLVIDRCPGVSIAVTAPGPENLGLWDRSAFVRKLQAASGNCILISIHVNAAGDGSTWTSARGATVFHHPANAAGGRLAARVLRSIGTHTALDVKRGVRQARFSVLAGTLAIPGVLVESGFMTNLEEACYLASDAGKAAIALALATVIKDYESGAAPA
jgi:N-acetylmuramoyl-L-alanine amidase